jgi:signal transduction histidine kinase
MCGGPPAGAGVASAGIAVASVGTGVALSRAFQVASLALVSYAVLGGLVVPPAPFFPASMLNTDMVLNVLGVPVQVLRSVVGLVLVVSIVRGLEVFRMEVDRRMEEMEQAQILMVERERIGRELHDGAIQTVYTAGLITESVQKNSPTRIHWAFDWTASSPRSVMQFMIFAILSAIWSPIQLTPTLPRSCANWPPTHM